MSRILVKHISDEHRAVISQDVKEMSRARRSFYALVIISTTIATYGLLSNSIAIVIGAMLVAPLMGPIFGVALGLSSGNNGMLRQAAFSETAGVLLAVITAFIIGFLPLRADFGSEIIARTQPTLYDIIIALASGLAGAYALTNEKMSPTLPGVAVATSLIPPLAASGLCLSAGQIQPAIGAFLLFFVNFLAIEIASVFVFVIFGVSSSYKHVGQSLKAFVRTSGFSIAVLMVAGIFMTHTLVKIIKDRQLSASIQSTLSEQLYSITGAQLSTVNVNKQAHTLDVAAVVLTPQQIEPELVARIEDNLQKNVDSRIQLVIRSLISSDANRNGPAYMTDNIRQYREEAKKQTEFLAKATKIINGQLRQIPGATLVDLRRELTDEKTVVKAVIRGPKTITPLIVKTMEDALIENISTPISLVVRSVPSRDANSIEYLYEDARKPVNPPWMNEMLSKRIEDALKRQLALQVKGAVLQEFSSDYRNGSLRIKAVALTPQVFDPDMVGKIESLLRQHVNSSIILTVQSKVEAEASSSSYLPVDD